jgi:RHS repeat-associated protein
MRARSPEGTQFNLNYDKLYRLSHVRDQNNALIEGFTYDATGNRLSKQLGANAPVNYSYAATDHELSNSTQIPGTGTMAYDERNRLNSVVGTATRTSKYNARGERVLSTGAAVNTLTVFSESGQLLSEGPAASTSSTVIYLDSMPVARVKAGVINPIEADHLGSPRVLKNTAGSSAVWSWNLLANTASGSNAFGEQVETGSVTDFNLRFPGQYSDGNGLSYNYFRDYEAGTGRYVESDPIGLNGGISTFGYVGGMPLSFYDPKELKAWMCARPMIGGGGILNHRVICANDATGQIICGGYGPAQDCPAWLVLIGKYDGESHPEYFSKLKCRELR